jgi:hypothetical protein
MQRKWYLHDSNISEKELILALPGIVHMSRLSGMMRKINAIEHTTAKSGLLPD